LSALLPWRQLSPTSNFFSAINNSWVKGIMIKAETLHHPSVLLQPYCIYDYKNLIILTGVIEITKGWLDRPTYPVAITALWHLHTFVWALSNAGIIFDLYKPKLNLPNNLQVLIPQH
jgi:hypothetical protein